MRKARYETIADRIGRVAHHDGNGAGRLLHRWHGGRSPKHENVYVQPH
jgi:hypothetical protein